MEATVPKRFSRQRRRRFLLAHEAALAAFSAGLVEKIAVYPLELVKTR